MSDDPPLRVQDEVEGVALPEVEAVGEDDVQGEAEGKVLDFIGMASNVYANKHFKEQESSIVSVFLSCMYSRKTSRDLRFFVPACLVSTRGQSSKNTWLG